MGFHSHVAVLAFPFGTHAAPLFALVRRMAASARGTLFSFFTSPTSNVGFFNGPDEHKNICVRDVWDGTPENEVFTGSHSEAVGLFLKASPGNFEKAVEKAESESGLKMGCLITDAFLWFGGDMAEERCVPWVAFWTAASCSLSAHVYTDEILKVAGSTEEKTEQEQRLTFIPGLENTRLTDLPPEIFLDVDNPSPLALTIGNMVRNLPKSSAVVLNSFDEIDPAITADLRRKFRHFLNVGPTTLLTSPNDPTECLPWLDQFRDTPKSVVYVSFGTVAVPPEPELRALARALEVLRAPFLWSLNDRAKNALPEGFVGGTAGGFGRIVPWAPQPRVLGHGSVGAFVTHCGWNSILESIAGRVPMVCRPFFGDQRLNGRIVEDTWRIGVGVPGGVFGEDGSTAEVLGRVLSDEGMRENVGRLREKALEAVGPDGSSSRNFEKLLEVIRSRERD